MLLLDLRTPQTGRVDPEMCRVCYVLRSDLTEAVTDGNKKAARAVVLGMYEHMIYGHPDDPRNKTPAR
jgi:hypothetical protein